MLALVYVTASALGGIALHVNGIVPPVTAAIIGATGALAMIQIHMAVSRMGESSKEELFQLRQEVRRLTGRVAQAEQQANDLRRAFEQEVTARRESIVQEMRGLEGMIQTLSKKFETRLNTVRSHANDAPAESYSRLGLAG